MARHDNMSTASVDMAPAQFVVSRSVTFAGFVTVVAAVLVTCGCSERNPEANPWVTAYERGRVENLRQFGKYFEPEFQKQQAANLDPEIDVDKLHLADIRARVGRLGYLFIDNAGDVVLALKYPMVQPFYEGLAAVATWQDKEYPISFNGYIDRTGGIVINPIYDRCGPFSEGLAAASRGRRWGYINRKGETIIPFRHWTASEFRDGLALVQSSDSDDTLQFIDRSGTVVSDSKKNPGYYGSFSEGLAFVTLRRTPGIDSGCRMGYVDREFKLAFQIGEDSSGFEILKGEEFHGGMAAVELSTGRSNDWAYISREGKLAIPGPFPEVGPFSEGLAAVNTARPSDFPKGSTYPPAWGYIDKTGKMVIKPQFRVAEPFSEGLAVVRVVNKQLEQRSDASAATLSVTVQASIGLPWHDQPNSGFIDKQGRIVIRPTFYRAQGFRNGLAYVHEDAHTHGFIDKTGKYVWKVRDAIPDK